MDSLVCTMHCLLAPLRQSAARTICQRLPHPHTRAGVQLLPLVASVNLRASTSLSTEQLTPASIGSAASWNGLQVYCKSPKWALPDPARSKGIHKSMLMKFVLTGAVPEA
eukprot:1140045-Pelagomonas_calceolata.AAC.7